MLAAALMLVGCTKVVEIPTESAELLEVGENEGGGNIVGVQAWVEPTSFASAEVLEDTLRLWLDDAEDQEWLRPDTVVVLPETMGTWLLLVDEGPDVIEAEDAETALRNLVTAHMPAFLLARDGAPAEDENVYAVYSMKADQVADAYQQVMGNLAAEYGVTLVGGSIVLPEPSIVDGRIVPTAGRELRNSSFIFDRDGNVLTNGVPESYPTAKEQEAIEPGAVGRLPVVDTPAGRLAVLVGSDSWFPDAWDQVTAEGAERVVAPILTSPRGAWLDTWEGYDGWPEPADVDRQDIKELTLAEAAESYGLAGRALDADIEAAMAVPLRGQMWDEGTDGVISIVDGNRVTEGPLVDAPVVANLWLPARDDKR